MQTCEKCVFGNTHATVTMQLLIMLESARQRDLRGLIGLSVGSFFPTIPTHSALWNSLGLG